VYLLCKTEMSESSCSLLNDHSKIAIILQSSDLLFINKFSFNPRGGIFTNIYSQIFLNIVENGHFLIGIKNEGYPSNVKRFLSLVNSLDASFLVAGYINIPRRVHSERIFYVCLLVISN